MRIFALIFTCIALGAPSRASPLFPVISNRGSEDGAAGWGCTQAKAGFRSETQNPHSGTRCLVFANESELEPEIYGGLYQYVGGVTPGCRCSGSPTVVTCGGGNTSLNLRGDLSPKPAYLRLMKLLSEWGFQSKKPLANGKSTNRSKY